MIYELKGRIDSGNAKEFEEKLMAAATEELVLDAANLEYISSAGLRVLLKLRKQQGSLKVINVSSEVYDIFDMTGFTEMLDVTKKIRSISLEGCKRLGNGATGTVYRYDDETIVKLYREDIPFEEIEAERRYARAAFVAGVPTAIPFDMVKVGNSYGNVYELMNSDTLTNAFITQPERYDEFIDKYAELVRTLAATKGSPDEFDSYKSIILKRCEKIEGVFGKETGDIITDIVKCMSEEGCIIHGDLHPANIMLQDGELMLIDMADVTVGNPVYELVALYRDMGSEKSKAGQDAVFASVGLEYGFGRKIWKDVFGKLMEGKTSSEVSELMEAIELINAVFSVVMLMASPEEIVKNIAPMMRDILINPVILPNVEKIKEIVRRF